MAKNEKPHPKHLIPTQISGTVSSLKNLLLSASRLKKPDRPLESRPAASAPGIEYAAGVETPPEAGSIGIQCIDYSSTEFQQNTFLTIEELLGQPKPAWVKHRWINVEGLNPYVINELRKSLQFHTLAAEDIHNVPQRPKLEQYDTHSLIVLDMVRMKGESLLSEQVSIIVIGDTVLTFQEHKGDVWDPIRTRIQKPDSRFKRYGTWYLVYALIDAIVDNIYPILERYGDLLNSLEDQAMFNPEPQIQQHIYLIKRELYSLRRSFWPVREIASKLTFDEESPVDKKVKIYLRDVHDHTIQIMELIESSREVCNSLQDFYISVVSNRMNEVMKALTIMASLFLPITFFAGVYGMNFEIIPELGWKYSYPVFWGACIICTGVLLVYFKRKGWIGK